MFGITEFVEDSSGNAGASLSAYAAAARIRGHIFSPSSASKGKLDQIKIFGAELHKTEGLREAATEAAEAYVIERNLPYLSHSLNPYFSEGMKMVSYELIKQLDIPIHHVVLPVGNGSLCIGMFRGFNEIKSFNKRTIIPKFHVIQSRNVMPIVNHVNGNKYSKTKQTVASGISVAAPPRLREITDVVGISNGSALAVCDNSILNWQEKLAAKEGIFCEPTSATAFSGLESLLEQGTISKDENVLIPITGTGLKEPL
jgi:threonine synthase